MQSDSRGYCLFSDDGVEIQVSVCNPTEINATFGTYTVYRVKGRDGKGDYESSRRYSQFDLIRQYLLKRWPGCFIPPIPEKKMIGKSQTDFVENRRSELERFCLEMAQLKHLWVPQIRRRSLVRINMLIAKHLKGLPQQSEEDIIRKYEQILTNLRGKNIDTPITNKVAEFKNYLKKVQPLISVTANTIKGFKETITVFLEAKNSNYSQYAVLYDYLLPEYEKICICGYLDEQTAGKLIFADDNDSKLKNLVSKMKDIVGSRNYHQLLILIEREEREINSFLDIYRGLAGYQKKVIDLKHREKQLELEQQNLKAGKQGLFKSIFKSNIEDQKRQTEREIFITKQLISSNSLLCDLINLLLGWFEIDRFKSAKLATYQRILKEIATMQVQFSRVHQQIATHVLDRHMSVR